MAIVVSISALYSSAMLAVRMGKIFRRGLVLVTVFVIALEALSSLFLAAPIAQAVGAPIFQLLNGKVPEIVRMSKDNILVTSRLKVSEDGYFGANSTFAIFTFTQNLKLKKEETERDIWEIASVSFSDLVTEVAYKSAYGITKSKIISPTIIDLRNNNNGGRDQRVILIDYSKLPKDSYLATKVPCYQVNKQATPEFPSSLNTIFGREHKADGGCTGIKVGGDYRTPATGVASYVYASAITVENYGLSSTSVDPRYTRDKISNWFAGKGTVNGIPIHITNRDPEDQGSPPYIEIPADGAGTNIAGSTNEYLKFKLTHVAGTYTNYAEAGTVIGAATGFVLSAGTIGTLVGAGFGGWIGKSAGSNVSWTIWSAELKDGTKIKPLIIVGDNKGPNWEMYYVDADFVKTDPTSSKNNPLSVVVKDDRNDYGGSAGKDTFHELYRYLSDNPPKVGDDSCADGRGLTTGPKKEPKTLKDLSYDQVSALNSNCLDRETDGWAPFWGVTVSDEAGDAAACDIKSLFGSGVDTAFNSTIKCLYDKIFQPIVGIAEEQLEKATEQDLYKSLTEGFVPEIWKVTRSLINIILVIALLVISFANITRFSLDTYAVKTALPKLILGVILANLSMLIIRLMTQFGDRVTDLFAKDLAGLTGFSQLTTQAAMSVGISGMAAFEKIFSGALGYVVLFFIAIIAFVLLIWLAFLLYFRLAAIYLLTILAPLTFVSYGIPGLGDKFFKMWWQHAVKWVFMVPAMAAIFWLSVEVARSDPGNASIAKVLVGYVLFITAVTLPMKWGGAVIQGASKFFKKATGGEWAQKKAGEKWNAAKTDLGERASLRLQQGYGRTWLGGLHAKQKAKRDLDRANLKKDVELLGTEAGNRARKGDWWNKAGRNEAALKMREELAKNQTEIVGHNNVKDYLEKNPSFANELTLSEIMKKSAENRVKELRNMSKMDLYKRSQLKTEPGKEDEAYQAMNAGDKKFVGEVKKIIEEFKDSTIDEQWLGEFIGREEKVLLGGKMTELYQMPELLEKYNQTNTVLKSKLKGYKALSDDQKNSAEGQLMKGEISRLVAARGEYKKTYAELQKKPEHSKEFGSFNIQQALGKMKDGNDEMGRIWAGRQNRGLISFDAGVEGQIKDEMKTLKAADIARQAQEFYEKKLDTQEKRDAYLRGDTAALTRHGLSGNDIRDGAVISKKINTILSSVGDYRNTEMGVEAMKLTNALAGKEVYNQSMLDTYRKLGTKERRDTNYKLTSESIIFGGQAHDHVQNAAPAGSHTAGASTAPALSQSTSTASAQPATHQIIGGTVVPHGAGDQTTANNTPGPEGDDLDEFGETEDETVAEPETPASPGEEE